MALIACPECGRKVSDQAAACPQCAYPLAQAIVEPVGRDGQLQPVETVELTGKRWKTMKAYAAVLFVVGMLLMFSSVSNGSPTAMIFGILILLGSLILGVRAAIGQWWHHR